MSGRRGKAWAATLAAWVLTVPGPGRAQTPAEKPRLTLDEFFNAVAIDSVQISPDGQAVVIGTTRPDWQHDRFRTDLWIYRASTNGGALAQLTTSGHDSRPQWSPDGQWIAFLSARASQDSESKPEEAPGAKTVEQVYVISPRGGEAFALTRGEEAVHAFAWSSDSRAVYFATREPWAKARQDAYKKEWNDVIQYRESERGDTIFSVEVAEAVARRGASPASWVEPKKLATTPYRVSELVASPDARSLAFATVSRSLREESPQPYGIDLAELPTGSVHELIHLQGETRAIRWSPDSRHIFFGYANGNPAGPYEDPQSRVYWVGATPGAHPAPDARWAAGFAGSIEDWAVDEDGTLLAAARLGTEVQPYTAGTPAGDFTRRPGWSGSYRSLSTARHAARVAFVYSALEQPEEVYLADGPDHLDQARPITAFNRLFTERALPEGRPYRWKADDGTTVEGMLIYPAHQFGAEHLRMLTLIHGGPEDADGNHFEADWYQWGALAATDGWLVFEPNYRGSVGYGDRFALGIVPHIVSRPGKDILEGVDQLVKEGIADPDHLTVGGYSYGGYMTNWLITQTRRFKAAVTGAGAVEHAANWGNDDTSYDDAYFLGGLPWAAEKNYNAEAALWQMGNVRTPTHLVAGAEDIRVYVGEDYLLERALHARGVPCTLLVFPGEGHGLDKNPWHGKIKVREELRWLDQYGR